VISRDNLRGPLFSFASSGCIVHEEGFSHFSLTHPIFCIKTALGKDNLIQEEGHQGNEAFFD